MIREIRIMPPSDFTRLYLAEGFTAPNAVAGLKLEDYESDKCLVEDELRQMLSARWISPDDFEVAWDENVALHCCGGVYSHRILGIDYANIINAALGKTKNPDIWGYHTSVEPEGDFTEFWIRNGIIYAPADGFAWEKYFYLS
jgi:hypothetical protein